MDSTQSTKSYNVLPQPPVRLQDEKLYAKLYYSYLRAIKACQSAPQPAEVTLGPLRRAHQVPERLFERRPMTQPTHASPIKCRHCQEMFQSRNALRVHLRNLKKAKEHVAPQEVFLNVLNDPTDTGIPYVALAPSEKKQSPQSFIDIVTEGRSSSGLLPSGLLDRFFSGEFAENYQLYEAPEPKFGLFSSDVKPSGHLHKNKFYVDAENKELIDNEFVDVSDQVGFRKLAQATEDLNDVFFSSKASGSTLTRHQLAKSLGKETSHPPLPSSTQQVPRNYGDPLSPPPPKTKKLFSQIVAEQFLKLEEERVHTQLTPEVIELQSQPVVEDAQSHPGDDDLFSLSDSSVEDE